MALILSLSACLGDHNEDHDLGITNAVFSDDGQMIAYVKTHGVFHERVVDEDDWLPTKFWHSITIVDREGHPITNVVDKGYGKIRSIFFMKSKNYLLIERYEYHSGNEQPVFVEKVVLDQNAQVLETIPVRTRDGISGAVPSQNGDTITISDRTASATVEFIDANNLQTMGTNQLDMLRDDYLLYNLDACRWTSNASLTCKMYRNPRSTGVHGGAVAQIDIAGTATKLYDLDDREYPPCLLVQTTSSKFDFSQNVKIVTTLYEGVPETVIHNLRFEPLLGSESECHF